MRLLERARQLGQLGTPKTHEISHIPLDDALILRAKTLIPARFHDRMWVAGSAASNYPMNGDVDVWVEAVDREIDPWNIIAENPRTRPTDPEDEDYQIALKIWTEPGLHIMAHHHTMERMLTGFDITCHSVAVNVEDGRILFGPFYHPSVGIANYCHTRPELTMERYLRFAKRYHDWSNLDSQVVRECAILVWDLMTREQMQKEIKYNYIDRGL